MAAEPPPEPPAPPAPTRPSSSSVSTSASASAPIFRRAAAALGLGGPPDWAPDWAPASEGAAIGAAASASHARCLCRKVPAVRSQTRRDTMQTAISHLQQQHVGLDPQDKAHNEEDDSRRGAAVRASVHIEAHLKEPLQRV